MAKILLIESESVLRAEVRIGGIVILRDPSLELLGFAAIAKPMRVHPDSLEMMRVQLETEGHDVKTVPRETVR